MKPLFLAAACLMVFSPQVLLAQPGSGTASSEQQASPSHQVGLIDLAYVFRNSERFTSLTEQLQEEIHQTDQDAKVIVVRIQKLEEKLQGGDLAIGSPEFRRLEEQHLQARTELEAFKRIAQQSFLRKEAEIYKSVYLEVEDAVSRYAAYYNYTLVLRFDRHEIGAQDQPQEIMNGMNRQVVYYNASDDMSEPVLAYLNEQWKKENAKRSGATRAAPQEE